MRRQRGTRRRALAVLAALAAAPAGCDDPPRGAEAKAGGAQATTARLPLPAGSGTVRGVVFFKGTPPEGETIPGRRCHSGAGETSASPVVVSDAGGLKDVMVYVKDAGPYGKGSAGPVVLDQVNCQYVPPVVGVRTGQVLRVTSSDPTLHNVHTLSVDNPAVNFGMTGAGQSRDLTFARAERFAVKCDVHPWMTAHLYVFDHPHFAATDGAGRYEIKGLPAGEHTLVFSHPFLGERERKVTMANEQAVEASLTFEKGRE